MTIKQNQSVIANRETTDIMKTTHHDLKRAVINMLKNTKKHENEKISERLKIENVYLKTQCLK